MTVGEKIKKLRLEASLTLEELACALGTSRQTIFRYEAGEIENIPQKKIEALARALHTTPAYLMGWESEWDAVAARHGFSRISKKRLPMLGRIACGEPIYAEQGCETYVCADSGIDADFCLTAVGDSMTGARIFDGDIVFVKQQNTVENGEIGVVVIGDEATLKRVYYYPKEAKLILTPENPRYAPMSFSGAELDTITILGRAVAFQSVIR